MPAEILDGKLVAQTIRDAIRSEVKQREEHNQTVPGLAVILVGADPSSEIYVRNKKRACDEVGFYSISHHLPATTSQIELESLIQELNDDPSVSGILVQLPLPQHINANTILELIDPKKDVDGFHPYNLGRLAQRRPLLRPCTPFGVMRLLEHYQLSVRGLDATVVGASNIVGRPMSLELLLAAATTTVCHKFTKDLANQVNKADLLVVAVGNPAVVKAEWIKPGAIVIDVGMNRLDTGKFVGDIDFIKASEIASWITPVPGGVGPMTIAMLLQNTLDALKSAE